MLESSITLRTENVRRNENSDLAGPKIAKSVELIFVTGSLLRTSRKLFSLWTDLKGCKEK